MMTMIRAPKRDISNHPVAAFDVETIGDKREFVYGVVVDDKGAHHFEDKTAMREWLGHSRYKGYNIFATNLEYDLTSVFDGFEYGIDPLYFRSKLINARYYYAPKNRVLFLDTGNLTNRMSVARLGKIVGLPKLETPPYLLGEEEGKNPWTCEKHGKEYCLSCYCERDATITYQFALLFQRVCTRLGCNVKNTIGSTGIDLWRRNYKEEELQVPPLNYNEYCRPAYHGGRTENFIVGTREGVNGYDINSLYPYSHVTGLYPHPNHLRHSKGSMNLEKLLSYEGVMGCTIKVPYMDYPPLPVVFNHRLYYPTGVLKGMWTFADIREALSLGGTLLDVGWCVWSTRTCRPLGKYMQDVYEIRRSYKEEGNPMEKVIKLLLNAPTGKFGQRVDNELYRLKPLDEVTDLDELNGHQVLHFPEGDYVTYQVKIPKPPDYINTLWAAQMTSLSRIYLMRTVRSLGKDAFYVDTDSVHTTRTLPVGGELGEWKQEFENRVVVYRGAKYYYSNDDKDPEFSKIRGIPRGLHRDYISDGVAHCKMVAHPKTAAIRGFDINQWYEMDKKDRDRYPRRKLGEHITQGGDYYRTRPFEIGEVRELLKDAPPPLPFIF